MISHDQVLGALRLAKGPLKNLEIRAAIFGAGKEDTDLAGSRTGEALQRLKASGQVKLMPGGRWALVDVIDCPACGGRGHLTTERAKKLGLMK